MADTDCPTSSPENLEDESFRLSSEPASDKKTRQKAARKAYYEANREKEAANARAYRESNPEKIREIKRNYYHDHPEKSSAHAKAYRKANPEKVKAYHSAYYRAHPEEQAARARAYYEANIKKIKEQKKAWHQANREKIYLQSIAKKHGISSEEYSRMIQSQGNRCDICQEPFASNKAKKPHVDHCHRTGKVRGLLCGQCNLNLGAIKDSVEIARSMARYLEKHEDQPLT